MITRIALPVLKRMALPFIKKMGKRALQNAGRFAIQRGKDLATDLIQGKSFKESIKARGMERVKRTVKSILKKRKCGTELQQSKHTKKKMKNKPNRRHAKDGTKSSKLAEKDIFYPSKRRFTQ